MILQYLKNCNCTPDITPGPQPVVITDKAEYVQGENIAGTLMYDGSIYQWIDMRGQYKNGKTVHGHRFKAR